jgi:hypothetical protein
MCKKFDLFILYILIIIYKMNTLEEIQNLEAKLVELDKKKAL